MLADLGLGDRVRARCRPSPARQPRGGAGRPGPAQTATGGASMTIVGGSVVDAGRGPGRTVASDRRRADRRMRARRDGGGRSSMPPAAGSCPASSTLQINGAHGIDVTTRAAPHRRARRRTDPLRRDGVRADGHHLPARRRGRAALAAWAARSRRRGARCRSGCTSRVRCSRRRARAPTRPLLAPPSAALIDGWSPDAGVRHGDDRPRAARRARRRSATLVGARRRRVDRAHRRTMRRRSPPRGAPAHGTSPICSMPCARSATVTPARSAPRSPTTTSSSG